MAPGRKERRRRAAVALAEYTSACTGEPVTEIVNRTAAPETDGESSSPQRGRTESPPTPAELRRLVTSLLRRCGKTDEHISAVLNAIAAVDKRADLVANRCLVEVRGADGVPAIVRSSCATTAVLIDEEIENLDGFLGTLKTIVGGSPAIHLTEKVTTEPGGKEGGSSKQRPAAGDSITVDLEAMDVIPGHPDPKDNLFDSSSDVLAEVVAAKEGFDKDPDIRAANDSVEAVPKVVMRNAPSLPLGWEFPPKLSFRCMLELFLVGEIREDGSVAVPPLKSLYPYDFEHLPRGNFTFRDMCLLVKYVKEVGKKRGVYKGETNEAGQGHGRYQYNDGKKWRKEQVEYLYEGVRSHFLPAKGKVYKIRRDEEYKWTTVLLNEQDRRRRAKQEAALVNNTSQPEDPRHNL